jgi:predicted nucleic acid-binding protein
VKKVFVDTGGWYALVDKKDPDHERASFFVKSNRTPFLTTNFVFDEVITLIRRRLGWSIARDFGERLKESRFVSLVSVRDDDEGKAWEIFLKYRDHDFSYTDCTSFAVMQRLRIRTAFTFDAHFRILRFTTVP